MKNQKFYKNGKEMSKGDYESLGDMISQCDYGITKEILTKKEVLQKYKHKLTQKQIEKLK